MFSPLINQLIDAFCCLPGIGPKSAQRMVLHLLERDRKGASQLAEAILECMDKVGRCSTCRTFSEMEICGICANQARDQGQLCVVETPADLLAIEQAGGYRGYYFVLMGHLSPIDGIGPNELGIDFLLERAKDSGVTEVILATNPTMEGEATSHYIAEYLKPLSLRISRIAHGVPIGGELEYVGGGTLLQAFADRKNIDDQTE